MIEEAETEVERLRKVQQRLRRWLIALKITFGVCLFLSLVALHIGLYFQHRITMLLQQEILQEQREIELLKAHLAPAGGMGKVVPYHEGMTLEPGDSTVIQLELPPAEVKEK